MSLALLKRLIVGVFIAVVVFYAGWLGMSYARSYLPSAPTASAQTSDATVAASNTSASAAPISSNQITNSNASTPSFFNTGNTVTIDGNTLSVAVASTTAEIDQGLQNQPSMNSSQGELFIFNHSAIYRFWMPNMNFALDMIWIGSDMKVVDVTKDAPPLPDPTKPVWFTPKAPAEYVLEVTAGYADQHNIQDGDTVTFTPAHNS